jgi:SpoIID/LytB domain protein
MLSWRSIRLCVTACLALALVLSGFLLSGVRDIHPSVSAAMGLEAPRSAAPTPSPEPAAPAPVVHTRQTVVPSAPAGAAHDVVAELPQTRTKSYGMVGVTWSSKTTETDITVKIRSLVKGKWTPWQLLGLDDEDPGDPGRPGTEPIWVGTAQGVAVRVSTKSGVKPADIKVVTIDPGGSTSTVSPASTDATTTGGATQVTSAAYTTSGTLDGTAKASTVATTGDGTPSYTPKPTIISRASWGASAGTKCDSPLTGSSTHGIVVHHTAGSNSYTKADSAKIVRGIQAYHVKGHGWCDIGYNFLVDKYGQIFEGRKGGEDHAVRAAHSGNGEVNTYFMGVSMMGDYDKAHLSAALESSMVKLVGWRMGTNYMKAKGTVTVKETITAKAKIGAHTLNLISGHRNVVSTECPGKYGYAWLSEKGGLRDRVEAYMSKYASAIKSRAASLGTGVTGPVYIGEALVTGGRKTQFGKLDMYSKTGDGTRTVTAAGGFRTKYASYGAQGSPLGFPTSDSPAVTKNGTFAQKFEHGSIYALRSSSGTTNHALWGPIATAYDLLGGPTGKLGAPKSSVSTVSGGNKSTFTKGSIVYTSSTKKTVAYTTSGSVIATTSSTAAVPPKVTGIKAVPTSSGATITWAASTGAKTYGVCLLTSATAKNCSKNWSGLTARSLTVSGLKPTDDRDYYVKVRAGNGTSASAWSALVGFDLVVSSTNSVTVPSSRTITLSGHGFGHGIGLSQYGAQNAAIKGLTWGAIMRYYYPGIKGMPFTSSIRVLLTADTTASVIVTGKSGIVFRNLATNKTLALPASISGHTVTRWQIIPSQGKATQSALQYRTTGGWTTYKSTRWTGDGQFEGPSTLSLVLPDNSAVTYRGALRSALPSSGSTTRDTLNVLSLETYLRGVVASEMPSSWKPSALQAQAVAARTYAARSIAAGHRYDICDTTACQVYRGTKAETAATDAAISATAKTIVTYGGKPALTQFSSSSGGYSAAGSEPYLKQKVDTYDNFSGNPNHSWTATVKATTVEKAYPKIGTLKSLKITARTGGGDWGGRVSSLTLTGSKSSVTITGATARTALGLKSTWFRFG